MKSQLAKFSRQEDINKRLLVLTTMTDLTDDTENIMDFLAYTKDGIIMTCLIPIKKIVAELRETTAQLIKGLYFSFKI